jgi:hypothetical protein
MQKEAMARILINDLLTRSGWRFFDDETGPANIALEAHVNLKKKTLDDLGDDFEKTANAMVDIKRIRNALLVANRKLVEVFEKKIHAKLKEIWRGGLVDC